MDFRNAGTTMHAISKLLQGRDDAERDQDGVERGREKPQRNPRPLPQPPPSHYIPPPQGYTYDQQMIAQYTNYTQRIQGAFPSPSHQQPSYTYTSTSPASPQWSGSTQQYSGPSNFALPVQNPQFGMNQYSPPLQAQTGGAYGQSGYNSSPPMSQGPFPPPAPQSPYNYNQTGGQTSQYGHPPLQHFNSDPSGNWQGGNPQPLQRMDSAPAGFGPTVCPYIGYPDHDPQTYVSRLTIIHPNETLANRMAVVFDATPTAGMRLSKRVAGVAATTLAAEA